MIRYLVPFLLVSTAVLAQDKSTTVSLGGFYDSWVPMITSVLSAIVTAIIAWVAAAFTRWTGIKVEAQHREALHSAAMSGVTAALTRFSKTAAEVRIDTKSVIVTEAVDWVMKSVPDAIKYLGISPESITNLVLSKISLLAETPSSVVTSQGNHA